MFKKGAATSRIENQSNQKWNSINETSTGYSGSIGQKRRSSLGFSIPITMSASHFNEYPIVIPSVGGISQHQSTMYRDSSMYNKNFQFQI